MKKFALYFALFVTWIFGRSAYALPPKVVDNPNYVAYVVPKMPMGHSSTITAVQSVILQRANASYSDERSPQLFRDKEDWLFECRAETCFCFTMEDEIATVTMGSSGLCGEMTDADPTVPDGGGVCFKAGGPFGPHEQRIDLKAFYGMAANRASTSIPGYRDGYCSNTTGTTGYPCDADNDCVTSAGSAGTCVLATPSRIVGTFVMAEAQFTTQCQITQLR